MKNEPAHKLLIKNELKLDQKVLMVNEPEMTQTFFMQNEPEVACNYQTTLEAFKNFDNN